MGALIQGMAQYFDGIRPLRRDVIVTVGDGFVTIFTAAGAFIARWQVEDMRFLEDDRGAKRYYRLDGETPMAERLEVFEPALQQAITQACPLLHRAPRTSSRTLVKIFGFGGAAVAVVVALIFVGIPALADWLAPYVPVALEQKFGRSVEAQARALFGGGSRRFVCDGAAGQAVLQRLAERMAATTAFPIRPRVTAADSAVTNAFALPGGQIFVLRGLIEKARTPDELAGVIGHEMGHVYYRHSVRQVLQSGATAFILGSVLGDFSGSGAVAIMMQNLASARYSREAETDADLFGADIMLKLGGDANAVGRMLTRIVGDSGGGRDFFASHPWTPDRVAAVAERAKNAPPPVPLMSDEDFAALKGICGARPEPGADGKP